MSLEYLRPFDLFHSWDFVSDMICGEASLVVNISLSQQDAEEGSWHGASVGAEASLFMLCVLLGSGESPHG